MLRPVNHLITRVTKIKNINAAGGVLFRESPVPNQGDSTEVNRQIEVVLIKRNGLWDIPKGKVEKHEGIAAAAVREVEEEIGVSNLLLTHFITSTEHTYEQKGKNYFKTTFWYGMVLPVYVELRKDKSHINEEIKFLAQEEEGIIRVEWVPLDIALTTVAFDNLKDVLSRFKDKMRSIMLS
jgi:8-oxo-dGTP pyrophosphatase MutT (NUDIX family)